MLFSWLLTVKNQLTNLRIVAHTDIYMDFKFYQRGDLYAARTNHRTTAGNGRMLKDICKTAGIVF